MHRSCSKNSLKGGYIADYIGFWVSVGDLFQGAIKRGTGSSDYSSYAHACILLHTHCISLVRPFSGLQVRPATLGHAKHYCPPFKGKLGVIQEHMGLI